MLRQQCTFSYMRCLPHLSVQPSLLAPRPLLFITVVLIIIAVLLLQARGREENIHYLRGLLYIHVHVVCLVEEANGTEIQKREKFNNSLLYSVISRPSPPSYTRPGDQATPLIYSTHLMLIAWFRMTLPHGQCRKLAK